MLIPVVALVISLGSRLVTQAANCPGEEYGINKRIHCKYIVQRLGGSKRDLNLMDSGIPSESIKWSGSPMEKMENAYVSLL